MYKSDPHRGIGHDEQQVLQSTEVLLLSPSLQRVAKW